MAMLEVDLLEVQLQCVQTAAWCCGWRVTGDGRGEGHIASFLPCVCNHAHEVVCYLSFVCACLVCKTCYFWAVWQRLSRMRLLL